MSGTKDPPSRHSGNIFSFCLLLFPLSFCGRTILMAENCVRRFIAQTACEVQKSPNQWTEVRVAACRNSSDLQPRMRSWNLTNSLTHHRDGLFGVAFTSFSCGRLACRVRLLETLRCFRSWRLLQRTSKSKREKSAHATTAPPCCLFSEYARSN